LFCLIQSQNLPVTKIRSTMYTLRHRFYLFNLNFSFLEIY